MEYNVKHDEKRHRFEYDRNGLMAFVEYDLEDGVMDIFHTLVPIRSIRLLMVYWVSRIS